MNPPPQKGDPRWNGHTTGTVYLCEKDPPVWFWSPGVPGTSSVTPQQLAQAAYNTIQLKPPTMGRSPSGTLPDGRPYGVVRSWTWFWTDPARFQAKTNYVSRAGVWARAVATPVSLSFDPGDGHAAVSCSGPGRPWIAGRDAQTAQAPGGCDYAYQRTTDGVSGGEFTATYSTTWSVSWTGSGGAGGTFPDLTTSSTTRFAVVEEQAVITR